MGMEFFERQWSTYHSIVANDLLEHRALRAATAAALTTWLNRRRHAHPSAPPPSMVDLGCGDLTSLAPVLRQLPLGSYTGLDLTATVLPVAAAAMGPLPYSTHWQEGDLLAWAQATVPGETPVDILHSAFAIHHLNDEEKGRFLSCVRQRLHLEGLFLWADVFRRPGESRAAYIDRYSVRVQQQWTPLSEEQKEQTLTHIRERDQPADSGAIQGVAEAAGWHWQWLWRGNQDSEALALLTPA